MSKSETKKLKGLTRTEWVFEDPESISGYFQLVCDLKPKLGAAGFSQVFELALQFESLLLKIRNKDILPQEGVMALLRRSCERIHQMLKQLESKSTLKFDNSELIQEMGEVLTSKFIKEHSLVFDEMADLTTYYLSGGMSEPRGRQLDSLINAMNELLVLRNLITQKKQSMESQLLKKTIVRFERISQRLHDISLSF